MVNSPLVSKRILIVEDEPAIADTLIYALSNSGYQTEHVGLVQTALTRLREQSFALAIVDVGLPDGNGFDLCRQLWRFSEMPVMFLTAHGDEIDRIVGLEIGADDYVTKPFSPLAAIRGAAELLEEPLPDADRRRFAVNAREQAERLDQLIERLLGLAALEQRQQLSEPRILDLAGLVNGVLAEKAPRLAQQHLRTALSLRGELPVLGEDFLLRQTLSNLLDNALAFAVAESVIEIEGRREGGLMLLRIRDHGPGIPDYALSRVFERFYSLPRPGNGRKSTGLGLPSFAK